MTSEVYHVFNRSIARIPIFETSWNYSRAINTIAYYQYQNLPMRFSYFNKLKVQERRNLFESIKTQQSPAVNFYAYSLMPNHFHFLLKQTADLGITNLLRNFQHSYSKYFNLKKHRTGSVFEAMFKAVRIETDKQLLHVIRYIHLNPVTAYVIEKESLRSYPWTSHSFI